MSARSFRTFAAILAVAGLGGLLTAGSACADASHPPHPRRGGHSARAPAPGLRVRPQSYLPAPAILSAPAVPGGFVTTPRCGSGRPPANGNCPSAYPYGSPSSAPLSRVDSRLPSIGGPWQPWQGRGPGYFGRAPGVPGILPPRPLPPHMGFPSPIGGMHVAPPGASPR